jgi:hypothetical protein
VTQRSAPGLFDLQAGFFDERYAASGGYHIGARGGQTGRQFAAEAGGSAYHYRHATG